MAKEEAATRPAPKQKQQAQAIATQKPDVPTVYPLHYKRFARRTSVGNPLTKPETPIYQWLPENDPTIHAPTPVRSIPALLSPSPLPNPTKQPSTLSSFLSPLITPASFLHGTKTLCVRHGRQAMPQATAKETAKSTSTARDMLTKSRSGSYVPTGLMQMRQVEATSPWALPAKKLTTTDAHGDACPDCLGELKIKRRELMQATTETDRRPLDDSSKTVGLFTSAAPALPTNPAPGVPREASKASQNADEKSLIISTDLGRDMHAVVIQHEGLLRRVVLNARNGQLSSQTIQRLSKELAGVSYELASVGVMNNPQILSSPGEPHDYSMVLDAPAQAPHGVRTSSIPELLSLIDQAANEIRLDTGQVAEHYIGRPDLARTQHHSLLTTSEFDNVIGDGMWHSDGLVSQQDIDGNYRALHERLTNASRKDSLKPADSASPVTERYSTPQTVSQQPLITSTPKTTTTSSNVPPRIITTKPTMPAISKFRHVWPTAQTPPPDHSTLHHAVDMAEPPSSIAPAFPTPKPPASGHHSPFSFLNPFHRSVAPTTPASPQPPQQTPPPAPQAIPTPTNVPTSRVRPADESPPATTPQPISNVPDPYHHAPYAPLDITHAAYADPKVKERQQVIRAAMRMDQSKRVQEASSAMEREARRKRSLGLPSAPQQPPLSKEQGKGGWGKKGWFG